MRIHYFTPYDVQGNIGKAYNEACSLIQDPEDWIVIRDGDTMFLTPDWGKQIEDTLKAHGEEYGLLGAVTNRIKSPHQRPTHVDMFKNMDMCKHYEVAVELRDRVKTTVTPTNLEVAGFFMAFQKKTWDKVKFEENTRLFDFKFSEAVSKIGLRKGIMRGLYVLHSYRIWAEDPTRYVGHLPQQ